MDFDDAIQAHTNWKLRLFSYARGQVAERIDVPTLRKDNVCALGRWLYGEGPKHAADPKFKQLQEVHSAFHQSAASLGAMVDRGDSSAAAAQLSSPGSEFNRLSIRVVGLLMNLRDSDLDG
jgi:methyl-accepting chemotaxis protein